ncbi:hypothetical protein OXYTRIMIC_037 [Oxytricha trifallax]|uniref:Uncharacterized protein n=1 Tax=Oxytricha trifallax TaxID=1172189 RepID=A0A073HYA6_9SPIT|nr:hypothetical protein OXYTRIMIC_037 [Oxytricha trifallax]
MSELKIIEEFTIQKQIKLVLNHVVVELENEEILEKQVSEGTQYSQNEPSEHIEQSCMSYILKRSSQKFTVKGLKRIHLMLSILWFSLYHCHSLTLPEEFSILLLLQLFSTLHLKGELIFHPDPAFSISIQCRYVLKFSIRSPLHTEILKFVTNSYQPDYPLHILNCLY